MCWLLYPCMKGRSSYGDTPPSIPAGQECSPTFGSPGVLHSLTLVSLNSDCSFVQSPFWVSSASAQALATTLPSLSSPLDAAFWFLPLFESQLRCHTLREALPDQPPSHCPPLRPASFPLLFITTYYEYYSDHNLTLSFVLLFCTCFF